MWNNQWSRKLLIVLGVIVAIFFIREYQQRDLVAGQAPALAGTTVSGEIINLASLDKPTLVYFWATWCPICKLERGAIKNLAQDYPIVSVAMQSPVDEVKQYVDESQFDFPVLLDNDGAIAKRFGVRAVPAIFIVSSQGEIAFTEVGYTTGLGLRLRMMLVD